MKNKTIYTDEPIKYKVIKDIFPQPEELVFRNEKKRITLFLSGNTITFFKKKAKSLNSSYQTMIRNLLDSYVSKMANA